MKIFIENMKICYRKLLYSKVQFFVIHEKMDLEKYLLFKEIIQLINDYHRYGDMKQCNKDKRDSAYFG